MKNKKKDQESRKYYPAGSEFEYEGTLVTAVSEGENDNHCDECFFADKSCQDVACLDYEREDNTDVHFKEVQL